MKRYVRAQWAYKGNEDNELSFPKGAVFEILSTDNPDWWDGCYEGRRGFLPANYVKLVPPEEAPRETTSVPTTPRESAPSAPAPAASPAAASLSASIPSIDEPASVLDEPATVDTASHRRSRNISALAAKLGKTLGAPLVDAPPHSESLSASASPSASSASSPVAPAFSLNTAGVWKQATAPDGRVYYYNSATKETSWTVPAGMTSAAAAPAAPAPSAPAVAAAAAAAAPVAPARAASPAPAPAAPARSTAPAPTAPAPTPARAAPAAPAAPVHDNGGLLPNWREAKDDNGRTYYYNALTRTTQWDPPLANPSASMSKSTSIASDLSSTAAAAPMRQQAPSLASLNVDSSASAAPERTPEGPLSDDGTAVAAAAAAAAVGSASSPQAAERITADVLGGAKTRRAGALLIKVDRSVDGRRAPDRKWFETFSVVHQGFILCFKDDPFVLQRNVNKKGTTRGRRDAIKPLLAVDLSVVGTAPYSYKNKKHVFSFSMPSGGELLMQAVDQKDMRGWVEALCAEGEARRAEQGVKEFTVPVRVNKKDAIKEKLAQQLAHRPSADVMVEQGYLTHWFCVRLEVLFKRVNGIPPIISNCVLAIEKRGINQEGIYRTSGNSATMSQLRIALDQSTFWGGKSGWFW